MFNLAVIPHFLLHYKIINTISSLRSSRPEVFCKKGVLRKFAKFLGKHLCQSLFFFDKVPGLRPATLFKKRLWHRCFPENFAKFLRTSLFIEHLQKLLLQISSSYSFTEAEGSNGQNAKNSYVLKYILNYFQVTNKCRH